MEKTSKISKNDDFIKLLHSLFKDELENINKIILDSLESDEPLIKESAEHLLKSGGKRIRPLLTILSSKLFQYEGNKNILLAAATEFIHAATLLHDDVVDSSKMRRFKPTVNSLFGNKTAILVGDFLFSQSFKLMVSANSMNSLKALSDASSIIAMGEVSQLSSSKDLISKERYFQIIKAKTAELFAAASKIGAIISNQIPSVIDDMYKLGLNIGLIFQIKDDILDYYSDNEIIGKNIGDDFYEGKITLPIIFLLEKIDDKDSFKEVFFKAQKNDDDLEQIINMLKANDIIKLLDEEILCLKNDCLKILNNLENIDAEIIKLLIQLIEFSGQRDN